MATVGAEVGISEGVEFISWGKALEWARYKGFPFKTVRGLRQSFKDKGGTYGKKARSPHCRIPVPVEQFAQYLGGYRINVKVKN